MRPDFYGPLATEWGSVVCLSVFLSKKLETEKTERNVNISFDVIECADN